jgi:hypothetical protein
MRGNIAPGGNGEARISKLFWNAISRLLRTSLHEHANREQDDYDDDYDLDHGSDHFVSPGKPRNEQPRCRREEDRPVNRARQ